MKTLILALVLATVSFAGEFAGRWTGDVEMKSPDGESRTQSALVVFKEDGGKLTGTGGPDESRQMAFEDVKVDGSKMTGVINDGPTTVNLEFTVSGDEMTGQAKIMREGTTMTAIFKMKRQKS